LRKGKGITSVRQGRDREKEGGGRERKDYCEREENKWLERTKVGGRAREELFWMGREGRDREEEAGRNYCEREEKKGILRGKKGC
jgi:hypothetical protein